MKFRFVVAAILAVVLSFLAPVAEAQNEFNHAVQDVRNIFTSQTHQLARNLCAGAEPGSAMEASWCYGVRVNPRYGYVEGYNPNAAYRGGYYGYTRPHRSRVGRILHGIFAPEPYYPYGTRPGYYGYGGYGYGGGYYGTFDEKGPKAQGKCIKDSINALKKAKVHIDEEITRMVVAGCTGNIQAPPPEASEAPAPVPPPAATIVPETAPDPTAAPVTMTEAPRKERGAVTWNGRLCNESSKPLNVYINGELYGTIPPWDRFPFAQLPGWPGIEKQVTWNY